MVHGTLRSGLALSVLLTACASSPRGARGSEQLLVHIDNNLTPAAAVWIWLVTENGGVQTLGGAEPECTKLWRLVHDGAPARFQFVARTSSHLTITSPPFDIASSELVRWDIAGNSVTTSAGSQGGPLEALRPPRLRVAGAVVSPATGLAGAEGERRGIAGASRGR